MGLSATVGALVMTDVGLEAGLVAGLATGTAMGVVNGLLIAWLALSPFVVTLGTLTFATGLANELSGRHLGRGPAGCVRRIRR